MATLKYVRGRTIGVVLSPRTDLLYHAHIGAMLVTQFDTIVSAGFVRISEGCVHVFGRSESLNIGPAHDDGIIIAELLGLEVPA